MDSKKKEHFVDTTVLNTPRPMACSTVQKKKPQKKCVDGASIILEERTRNGSNAGYKLEEQRSLAETSLKRASNVVAGIPSRYLKSNNTHQTRMSSISDSTVNESDLLRTPANTSTPKSSLGRTSLSNSVAQLSFKFQNSEISVDHLIEEFQAMNVVGVDSIMFKPAEEAASMLLADELSWRRQNEIPVNKDRFSDVNLSAQTSIGEFFRQRSDTLSMFNAKSPTKKHEPVPLIETSKVNNTEVKEIEKKNKSLSVSAIQRCLQSDNTPRKAAELLLKNEPDISRYLLDKKMEKLSALSSKSSSYTSDQSDTEMMRCIYDKENVNTLNATSKSAESISRSVISPNSRSSSRALTSLPDGRLPIESTVTELIWGCVKIDKSVTQEFSLRNKSSKRLGIQMSLTGHDYKIRTDSRIDSDLLGSTKVILHPHESKMITVSFVPTKMGACVDLLSFSPIDSKFQQTRKQSIKLFGYGGQEKVEFNHLTQDMMGKFWLSLGKIDNQEELNKTFSVVNVGMLPSFIYIKSTDKNYCQLRVDPNFFVLLPKEEKQITIRNLFTSNSFKLFQKILNSTSMFELGNLSIISGTEVNRGRLRRLCRILTDEGTSVGWPGNILQQFVQGEVMPTDISKFKESKSSLRNILDLFNHYEVILTAVRDPDQTIVQYSDESAMYHTLCDATGASVLENTISHTLYRLEPSTIILNPPIKVTDYLFLTSKASRQMEFKVNCDPKGLEVKPRQGILSPNEETKIHINCPQCPPQSTSYKILVTLGNELYESEVKVKC